MTSPTYEEISEAALQSVQEELQAVSESIKSGTEILKKLKSRKKSLLSVIERKAFTVETMRRIPLVAADAALRASGNYSVDMLDGFCSRPISAKFSFDYIKSFVEDCIQMSEVEVEKTNQLIEQLKDQES